MPDELQECIRSDRSVFVGDRLVLAAKPEIVRYLQQRLVELESNQWRFGENFAGLEQNGNPCCVFYRFEELPPHPDLYTDSQVIISIMARIQSHCSPSAWKGTGGDIAYQAAVGNAIAISASADLHRQIAAYLNSSEFETAYATVIDSSR